MKSHRLILVVSLMGCLLAISTPGHATIPASERDSLIALYNSTNGSGWTSRFNWRNSDDTGFSAVGTECNWYGVTCSGDTVTELRLPSNQLSGSIPAELGNLTNLHVLDLSFNDSQLSGSIPVELGHLSNLLYLSLSSNQLSGSIPAELGNLIALGYLDLSSNQLSGSIPAELGNLSNLQYLELYSNQLSGSIPTSLGNLSNLECLELQYNQLSGSIPLELGNLSNLYDLGLHDNELSGSIPPELGNLSNLYGLVLRENQLRGQIPTELANLSNMNYTDLGYNALYTNDATLQEFLAARDPDWYQTQTIAPAGVSVSEATTSSIVLKWTPIAYTGDVGNYGIFPQPPPPGESIFYDGFEGGDTEWWGIGNPWVTTTDKSDGSVLVDGLDSGTNYNFVIRALTEPHGYQHNEVISGPSGAVSETTSQ